MRTRLDNGIEFVHYPRTGANVATIQCVVWAGSLDERPNERGVAHFLEHMLFKGTDTRGVGQIASLIEGAGGDINAYTTFDKTAFYLTLPSQQAELGFDVLSDAIFNSSFDAAEFEREKEVVLEEIRRGNDDPGGQIGRKIFSTMYDGSEAGRPIIGFSDEVKKFSRDTLVGFWSHWYLPENMTLVVVGNLSTAEAKVLAEKYFGSKTSKNPRKATWGSGRHNDIKRANVQGVRAVIIAGDFEQTRMDVAIGAPTIYAPDCAIIDTAAYILGGSEVSRLQRRLKEKEAVVNGIGASAYTPNFEGVFEISAALEPENFEAALRSIGRELSLLTGAEPATQQEVDRARAASRIGRIHREETVDGVARAIVAGMATPMKEKFEEVYENLANSFSPDEVSEALAREWQLENALIVVLCDKSCAPKEPALVAAYLEGVKQGLEAGRKKSGAVASKTQVPTKHSFEVGNGIPVIYRQIPGAKMFSVTAATEGGLRGEDLLSAGSFHAIATLLGLATKAKSYDQFSGRLEDMGSVLGGFSGKDSLGFEMHCTEDQIDEMLDSLGEAMLEPVFPAEQWESYRRETLESLKLQQDSASWICMRRLHNAVYGRHPYSLPISGIEKSVKTFTSQALQASYESWRDDGPWVFAVAGGAPLELVQRKLTAAFKNFAPKKKKRIFSGVAAADLEALGIPLSPRRKQEQAHLALAGSGPGWGTGNRPAMDVLINILGGHGGRLFTTLRDQESLAYSVSPLHSQGMMGGMVGAYIATAVDKVDQAMAGLERELRKVAESGATEDEITRSKSYILGSHVIGLQRTSSQAMTMALMELYGLGWNDFERYPETVRNVSASEITKAAAEFFNPAKMKRVIISS
jgi:zinc protease